MERPQKKLPAYALKSVDAALRLATILQLEGTLTVADTAERLGVARSTAHRLLQMLVYRDFASQDSGRTYRAGPVLELAAHSRSGVAELRTRALPHLQQLVDTMEESANLAVRTGWKTRFIASVECLRSLRVGSREGMVFPAHRTTAGLLLLAELSPEQVGALYAAEGCADRPDERLDLSVLRVDLARARRSGFALNKGRSERGVVAIGVPVRAPDSEVLAGLSVSIPSVRYSKEQLPTIVGTLRATAGMLERDLRS